MNESIGIQKEKVKDKLKVDMKYNQLQKLETKIETNLNSHRKTLQFFKDNDSCPTCTQPIDKEFKSPNAITTYNNFKTRERSIARRRINTPRKSGGNGQNIEQNTRHDNCRDAKINTSLENIKKHSDQIHQDISMAQNNDIESIKIELENMQGQLKV